MMCHSAFRYSHWPYSSPHHLSHLPMHDSMNKYTLSFKHIAIDMSSALSNTTTFSLPLSFSFSLLPLFFSSWMRLIRDWHARGAALTQLPRLLRQQPRVHLLHPDAAGQRHPATSTRLQTGGGWHAQSEGVGGVAPSPCVYAALLVYLWMPTWSSQSSFLPLSLPGLWWQQ